MALQTEKFFKNQLRFSKISIFLATTFSFLIMSVLGLFIMNANAFQQNIKEDVVINAVLSESLKENETRQLIKSLSLLPHVKSVNYISKDAAAQQLKSELGENFLELLDSNPLTNIVEIKYVSSFVSELTLFNEKTTLISYDQIDDVFYDQNLLALIDKSLKKLGSVILLITCLIIGIAFTLINSNIRLTIYAKRFSLKTMQLVGATKSFIQKPFLISSLFSAFWASLFGILLLLAVFVLAQNKLPSVQYFLSFNEILYLIIVVSLVNILISFFCTWICVRNYLNLSTEDLYK